MYGIMSRYIIPLLLTMACASGLEQKVDVPTPQVQPTNLEIQERHLGELFINVAEGIKPISTCTYETKEKYVCVPVMPVIVDPHLPPLQKVVYNNGQLDVHLEGRKGALHMLSIMTVDVEPRRLRYFKRVVTLEGKEPVTDCFNALMDKIDVKDGECVDE